jgi:transposase
MELREIISKDNKAGIGSGTIAKILGIPQRTIQGLLAHERKTGSIMPMPHKGRQPALDGKQMKELKELIETNKDITLEEIKEKMGLTIDKSAIWRIVHNKLGFNFKKKSLHASERDKDGNMEKRKNYIKGQEYLAIDSMVFLDESGVNTGMTRRYGRAVGGERVNDSAPVNHGKNTTVIGAVRFSGVVATKTIKGAMNGEAFSDYITHDLIPALKPGDIVIMDNLRTHKVKGIKEAIEKAGATVLYLPPYSPDLNPIEEMWSKMKAYLRKMKARTEDLLCSAVNTILGSIPLTDIFGWFSHAGYNMPCYT